MKVKIQTLTPVHIGSGREIQSGYEYAFFPQERKVAVLDPEKILGLIGEDQLGLWVSCIEKGENLLEKLPQLRGKNSDDLAQRSMVSSQPCNKPVREQLRNGSDRTLLPGSSLKGALRTVVFGETMLDNSKLAKEKRNLGMVDYRGGFRWSDAPLQKTLFGQDPNHDIFRLLQVGDAHFGATEVFKTQIANLAGNKWILDKADKRDGSAEAWVEALPPGATATAEIRFNETLKAQADKFNTFNSNAPKLKLPALFKLANSFTERLVSDEIKYWSSEKIDPPQGFEDYVPEMESLLTATKNCTENECVLRLGWGSGFRSMTGDWQGEMHDDDYDALVNSLRSRKYEGLMFPKTVRFSGAGVPMGFIKLSILN